MNTSNSPLSVELRNQGCNACSNGLWGNEISGPAEHKINYEDDVLKKEIDRLSLQDREAAQMGVNGESLVTKAILKGVERDEEYMDRKFQELDEHIASRTEHPGFAAYQILKQECPSYVENNDFKKGFLRADRYNPKQAAGRLLLYLEEKLDLFGREKLTKDIFWEDIGKDAQDYLKLGGLQILPKRDKAGRLVVFMGKVSYGDSEDVVRTIRKGWFYFLTTLGEVDTEDGRIRGYVAVLWRIYSSHQKNKARPGVVKAVARIGSCTPAKISAYHICRPPSTLHLDILTEHSFKLLPLIQVFGYLRLVRVHYGTAQECLYKLLNEYGMHDCFPFHKDDTNETPFTVEQVYKWIAQRQEIEAVKKEITGSVLGSWSSQKTASWLSSATARLTSNESRTSERWSFGGPLENPFAKPNSNNDSFEDFLEDPLFPSEELKPGNSTGSREHASATINRSLLENDIFDSKTSQNSEINPNEKHPTDETLETSNTSRQNEIRSGRDNIFDSTRSQDFEINPNEKHDSEINPNEKLPSDKTLATSNKTSGQNEIRSGRDIPSRDMKLVQGKSLVRKEGNVWMQKLIDEHFDLYFAVGADLRSEYLQGILNKIQDQGQRLWKEQEPGTDRWVEIAANDALTTLTANFQLEQAKRGVPFHEWVPTLIRGCDIPNDDITFGRGKPFQAHPGNIWFRQTIAGYFEEYDRAEKGGKMKLSRHIVEQIKSENRRVWVKSSKSNDDDLWVEADDKAVREKVSYTFRGIRRDSESKQEKGAGMKRRSSQSPSGIPYPKSYRTSLI